MKNLYLFLALMVTGYSVHAAPLHETDFRKYGEVIIFVEDGVEFAVFPDGQFDFNFIPDYFEHRIRISTPRISFSFNSGHDYDRYVQFDDFGAPVQIGSVPVFYDHFGRIIGAGNVRMYYTPFGRLARVGNLILHYNPRHKFTHYSGYINRYNPYYEHQPWHRHYRRPSAHSVIVYHQPYRAYYNPRRMAFQEYQMYYLEHHKKDFRKRYYTPWDRVESYHRGRRTEAPRVIESRERWGNTKNTPEVRSNQHSRKDRVRGRKVHLVKQDGQAREVHASHTREDRRDSRDNKASARNRQDQRRRSSRASEDNSEVRKIQNTRGRTQENNSQRSSRGRGN